MNADDAIDALSALAQQHRLAAFRLLVRAGPQGVAAGEIAHELGVPNNTMSTHLGILARAGIIESQRTGRSIAYRIKQDGILSLFEFLVSDCCAGQPELCAPLTAMTQKALACCEEDDSKPRRRPKRRLA